MALKMNVETLGDAILKVIESEIEKVAAEEAEAAAQRVRERTKGRIAEIAATVLDNYSIERMERDLVIRVRHENRTDQ